MNITNAPYKYPVTDCLLLWVFCFVLHRKLVYLRRITRKMGNGSWPKSGMNAAKWQKMATRMLKSPFTFNWSTALFTMAWTLFFQSFSTHCSSLSCSCYRTTPGKRLGIAWLCFWHMWSSWLWWQTECLLQLQQHLCWVGHTLVNNNQSNKEFILSYTIWSNSSQSKYKIKWLSVVANKTMQIPTSPEISYLIKH